MAVVGNTATNPTTIPFSLGKMGAQLQTYEDGSPQKISFAGFGFGYYNTNTTIPPGAWETGNLIFTEDMNYPTSYISPHDAVLKKINIVFSTSEYNWLLEEGTIIRSFVCICTANSEEEELVCTILQNTITYVGTYEGGIEYPRHTLRWGASADLNTPLSEGTLVSVAVGIIADGTEFSQNTNFAVSGSLYLE